METSAVVNQQPALPSARAIDAKNDSTHAGTAAADTGSAAEDDGLSFRDVLSMLNPLQYLPVVGSIYRSVTGDMIPESVRTVGSLVVSGLLGGVVGVAINAASTALQKLVGFNPDDMAHAALASLGLVGDMAVPGPTTASAAGGEVSAPPPPPVPWSRAQRAAYRIPASHAFAHPPRLDVQAQTAGFIAQPKHATAAYARGGGECERPLDSAMLLLDCSI